MLTSVDGVGDVTVNVWDDDELTSTTVGYGTPAAAKTSYTYNELGQQVSETDPDNNTTTLVYNALGMVLSTTNALGQTTTSTYDKAGNVTSRVTPDGRSELYTYDGDRLVKETWLNADGSVVDVLTYTYDNDGNMLTATNNAGTYTMTYDGNRLASITNPFGVTLSYTYDENGNVTSVADSLGGLTTYTYNANGQELTQSYQDANTQLLIVFTYDLAGNRTSETRYHDLVGKKLSGSTVYGYDGNELVSQTDFDKDGKVLNSYNYGYDLAQRLASKTENGVTTPYGYDTTSQLVQSGGNVYAYDPNGNRNMPGYVIGPNNELLSDGTWNYLYDLNGNRIKKVNIATGETFSYAYDNNNELTSVTDSNAKGKVLLTDSFTNDVFGQRIAETVVKGNTTTITQSVYDRGQDILDLNATTTKSKPTPSDLNLRYIHGVNADELLAQITADPTLYWMLTDRQGSVRGVTNTSGKVVGTQTYDAYGNIIVSSLPVKEANYGFDGYQWDSQIGLALPDESERPYEPMRDLWIAPDPTGLAAGPNPYEYEGDSPTNGTDPTGTGEPGGSSQSQDARAERQRLVGLPKSADRDYYLGYFDGSQGFPQVPQSAATASGITNASRYEEGFKAGYKVIEPQILQAQLVALQAIRIQKNKEAAANQFPIDLQKDELTWDDSWETQRTVLFAARQGAPGADDQYPVLRELLKLLRKNDISIGPDPLTAGLLLDKSTGRIRVSPKVFFQVEKALSRPPAQKRSETETAVLEALVSGKKPIRIGLVDGKLAAEDIIRIGGGVGTEQVIEQPGFWASIVPVSGHIREAQSHEALGDQLEANVHYVLAVWDVTLVPAAVRGVGKAGAWGLAKLGGKEAASEAPAAAAESARALEEFAEVFGEAATEAPGDVIRFRSTYQGGPYPAGRFGRGGTLWDADAAYRSGQVRAERLIHEAGRRLGVDVRTLADEIVYIPGADAPFFTVQNGRRILALNERAVTGADESLRLLKATHEVGHARVYNNPAAFGGPLTYEAEEVLVEKPQPATHSPLNLSPSVAKLGHLRKRLAGRSRAATTSGSAVTKTTGSKTQCESFHRNCTFDGSRATCHQEGHSIGYEARA